ncbi:MAG: family 20 glycosylhydrolase [Gammaproteobacteria bacterium]|nr:family 20 glycosylhydrolase [Gammaproteobacteria bacterium]
MSTEPLLLPPPRRVETGPARTPSEAPNTLLGDASPRLERAFERLPPMGLEVRFEVAPTPASTPDLHPDAASEIEFADAVTVRAASEWGAIHGLATLAQLAGKSHAITRIHDHPAYPWRGLMIDVARHFIPLPALRRTLDAMSLAKLNVLHLHLTDDQAFRFRSEAHPELASAEAWDAAELTELVAYAADRAIRIVPELDMPGHVTSWLVARPEWGAGSASGPSRRFGVHEACLDPTNPAVLRAVETLLGELADIFPDPFLHFGGDEVNGTWWNAHEGVQTLMRSQGFRAADVQADFNRKLTTIIRQLGRRPLAWDEALHPALARDTLIQAWRGNQARDAALAAGFDCVLSAPYYLDLFYPASLHHCFDPGGDLAAAEDRLLADDRTRHVREGLQWMAGFASFPGLPDAPAGGEGRILGGEACLWSELVDEGCLDSRLWGRLPAIAERFWCGSEAEEAGLLERTVAFQGSLARLGIVPEDSETRRRAFPELAPIEPLVEMLEPVKWYRRLLGAAFERRVSGLGESGVARPYDADTPLNRLVDHLPPESLASRRAEAELDAGGDMQRWIEGWRRQREAISELAEVDAGLRDASRALGELADILDDGDCSMAPEEIDALAGPFDEYLLPLAHAVARRRR